MHTRSVQLQALVFASPLLRPCSQKLQPRLSLCLTILHLHLYSEAELALISSGIRVYPSVMSPRLNCWIIIKINLLWVEYSRQRFPHPLLIHCAQGHTLEFGYEFDNHCRAQVLLPITSNKKSAGIHTFIEGANLSLSLLHSAQEVAWDFLGCRGWEEDEEPEFMIKFQLMRITISSAASVPWSSGNLPSTRMTQWSRACDWAEKGRLFKFLYNYTTFSYSSDAYPRKSITE